MKFKRNEPCPCGSNKKYKKCCLPSEKNKKTSITGTNSDEPHFLIHIDPEVEDKCEDVMIKLNNGDLPSAKIDTEHLLQEYPHHHVVNYLQGMCMCMENNLPEGIAYLTKATEIHPFYEDAYFNLGIAHQRNINIPQSVACFRKVIELDGELTELGKMAKQHLENHEQMFMENSGFTLDEYLSQQEIFDQAFKYLTEKKYEDAITLFLKVLEKEPDNVQCYGNLGIAYASLGDDEKSLVCFNKALAIDPSYGPAIHNKRLLETLEKDHFQEVEIQNIHYYKERLALERASVH
jgi:tetratricopeptide (TPR) repeat protein